MKYVLFIGIVLSAFQTPISSNLDGFHCVLTSDKEVYNIGELPKFSVKIYNDTKKSVYFIGALDASDVKWRYPYCYFTIDKPGSKNISIGRCGNMNSLRMENFKLVEAGQTFDPYDSIDNHGFFEDFEMTDKETFSKPGVYKIKFHYSTNSQNIDNFMGDRPIFRNSLDSIKLDELFRAVPKLEITSNEIIFKVF